MHLHEVTDREGNLIIYIIILIYILYKYNIYIKLSASSYE